MGRMTGALLRVLEACAAAIGSVEALQGKIAAPLAWDLPITFDLASLALIAMCAVWSIAIRSRCSI